MSRTTLNVHHVSSISVNSTDFGDFISTVLTLICSDGLRHEVSIFSAEPLMIEGAELLNFAHAVAQENQEVSA